MTHLAEKKLVCPPISITESHLEQVDSTELKIDSLIEELKNRNAVGFTWIANRLTRYADKWSNAIKTFHKSHDVSKKTILVYAEGLNLEEDYITFSALGQTQILIWSGRI